MKSIGTAPLYLPMETKARELHARVLLAGTTAEAGIPVLLGHIREIKQEMEYLPPGILAYKSVAMRFVEQFRRMRSLGHRIVAWDEEGLVYSEPSTYLTQRVAAEALEQVERFFAWGSIQAGHIRARHPGLADRVVLAGNARFDILRPEYRHLYAGEGARIRSRHGKFILINTNFSVCNHFHGPGAAQRVWRLQGRVRQPGDEEMVRRLTSHKCALLESFREMLPFLSRRYPELKIVVRPHPSENQQTWVEHARGLDNVVVSYEGPVAPWILAGELLIHNGCTTGIEAFALGRPVVAYRPCVSDEFDPVLPNAVSETAATPDQLGTAIDRILHDMGAAQEAHSVRMQQALEYVANISGATAVDRIVGELRTLAGERAGSGRIRSGRIARNARRAWHRLRSVEPGAGNPGSAYLEQKFPGLEASEITACLESLGGPWGRFRNLSVTAHRNTRHCYWVRPAG